MESLKNIPVKCPNCGQGVALLISYLDRALKSGEHIDAACIHCEHKWTLHAHDKDRVRNQYNNLKLIASAGRG